MFSGDEGSLSYLFGAQERKVNNAEILRGYAAQDDTSLVTRFALRMTLIRRFEGKHTTLLHHTRLIFAVLLVTLGCPREVSGGSEHLIIRVDAGAAVGEINPRVFGTNLLGFDPSTYEKRRRPDFTYSDYGAGLWDPLHKRPSETSLSLLFNAGVKSVRFPGGCGSHHYNWKKTIGPDRRRFRFGLDEFLKTAQRLGAEPVITVSYFTGTEKDAADLVEYLNAPDDGRHPWASLRAKNGRKEPYRVRYFEIGNEEWHGDHDRIESVNPADYAVRYLKYYAAMKAVDPSVQIGAILHTDEWNEEVTRIIGSDIDFGSLHLYLSGNWADKDLVGVDPHQIFAPALAEADRFMEPRLRKVLAMLEKAAGKPVPLAITEYNSAFLKDKPVPYRHSLGGALINAEMLRVFMDPENRVLMAHSWDAFSNFWGMVRMKPAKGTYTPDYARPNFYVYQLYREHFGERLLPAKRKGGQPIFENRVSPFPFSLNASASADGRTLYLMVVNRDLEAARTVTINVKGFEPGKQGRAWVLNGPSVASTNEDQHDTVKVTEQAFQVLAGSFEFTFEPHSLTAIELERK